LPQTIDIGLGMATILGKSEECVLQAYPLHQRSLAMQDDRQAGSVHSGRREVNRTAGSGRYTIGMKDKVLQQTLNNVLLVQLLSIAITSPNNKPSPPIPMPPISKNLVNRFTLFEN
jgi:hypothetical protein